MVGRKNRKKPSAQNPHFVHLMMCASSSHLRSGKIDNPDFLCPTLEVALVGVLHRSDRCHRADDLQEPWGRAGQSWHAQFNNGNRPKFQSTDPVAINADFSSWSLEKFSHGRLKIENVENKQRKRKCTRLCGRKEYGGGGLTIINVRRVWHICIMQFSITNAKA